MRRVFDSAAASPASFAVFCDELADFLAEARSRIMQALYRALGPPNHAMWQANFVQMPVIGLLWHRGATRYQRRRLSGSVMRQWTVWTASWATWSGAPPVMMVGRLRCVSAA